MGAASEKPWGRCKEVPTSRSGGCSDVRGLIQQSPKGTFLFLPLCAPNRWIWKKSLTALRRGKKENPLERVCVKHKQVHCSSSIPNSASQAQTEVWWDSLSLAELHSSFRVSLLLLPLEVVQPDFVVQKWKEEVPSVSLLTHWWCVSPSMAQISPVSIINQDASLAGAFIPQFCAGSFLFLLRKILLGSRIKYLWTVPVT